MRALEDTSLIWCSCLSISGHVHHWHNHCRWCFVHARRAGVFTPGLSSQYDYILSRTL